MKEFNKDIKLKQLKLKNNKSKYIKYTSIILSCVILLVGIIYFTFAKFESNKSYTLIEGRIGDYTSGDLTIGVNVNGSNVNDFPENNGNYILTNIECSDSSGNVDVEYDATTWHITDLALTKKTKCTYYFVEKEEWTFDYKTDDSGNGTYQEFIVPKTGNYKIELWGAGIENSGAYISGIISLNKQEPLYLYVGQSGVSCNPYTSCTGLSYNGGGAGGYFDAMSTNNIAYRNSGGSGATDIRIFEKDYVPTSSDLSWDSTLGLRSRIMVAAGGGDTTGYAGGLLGYTSNLSTRSVHGGSGNQTSGGSASSPATSGAFGHGGNGYVTYPKNPSGNNAYGGSAGYYGGGGGNSTTYGSPYNNIAHGGGGSSYISGHTGCVAITSSSDQTPKSGCTTGTTDNECSIHYSGLKFTNTKMIDGKGYPWTNVVGTTYEQMPNPEGGYYDEGVGHSGNGYARITYLGEQ